MEEKPKPIIDNLLDPIRIPRVVRVAQSFDRPRVVDVASETQRALAAKDFASLVPRGKPIAIAVGSRGISNQPLVLRTLVAELRRAGGDPFLVPAMGSHGGATAEGQRSMLAGLGVTEQAVGAPIRSSMEVVRIGTSANGLPVHLDRIASEAAGIVLVNRVKPHVAFRGPYESGLMKMLAIGLGKQHGADICHNLGFGRMAENIPAIGRCVLATAPILFAVALLENAYHETCRIEVLRNGEIAAEEPRLLEEARVLSPRLPFQKLDVLIIDEIGKNISGTGFDTNAVGRYHTPYASGGPQITRMVCLDLTDASHGNANGLGMLDFTTRRVFDKLDFEQTYPNSLTSTVPGTVKIPMVLRNDRQAIQAAIKTCNASEPEKLTLARIKNTLSLSEIECSESLLAEVRKDRRLTPQGEPYELDFDASGNLLRS